MYSQHYFSAQNGVTTAGENIPRLFGCKRKTAHVWGPADFGKCSKGERSTR